MKPTTDNTLDFVSIDTPPLEQLRSELDTTLRESTVYLEQYRHDFETRFCLWDGQSRDGRRWQKNQAGTSEVRPWDGASDARTFTADDIINEQVDVAMAAYHRATIQVTALRSDRLDVSGKITILLQWLLRNHLADELDAELELAVQWRQGYGLAVLGVWWMQDYRLTYAMVTLAELLESAMQQAQEGNPQPLQALADPTQDARTVEELIRRAPLLDRRTARRFLTSLRETGQAQVPRISIVKNQPCIEALRPFLDVFFPADTRRLQLARWVQRRRMLSLGEIRAKVYSGEWDKEWADSLIEQRGKSYGALNDFRGLVPTSNVVGTDAQLARVSGALPNQHYVEVYDAYYKGTDEKTGAPLMLHTVWSPLVTGDLYGRHELFGYEHGEQPFVELVRERVEPALADSRSTPEIAATFQNTIKTQRDARNDRAQITTVPPLLVPMWRAGTHVKIGPSAQIPEKVAGELKWMSPAQNAGDHNQAEANAEFALAQYFGRMRNDVSPQLIGLKHERLVGGVLREIKQVVYQMLQLSQQYMSDVETEQIVGAMRIPFRLKREEIQGKFSLLLNFDTQNLNPELVTKKLEAFQKFVLSFDTLGVVNRGKLAELGARMLDPFWADSIVGTPEMASQNEAEDELRNLQGIVAGVEPPMRTEGQNYQLRLQVLTKGLQDNPWLAQRIAQQPDSQAMLKARIQHLTTLAEQFGINREIGRTGAQPGLAKLREEMQPPGGAVQTPALTGGVN